AVLERQDAIEIADEIPEIGEQRPQVHFGADRGQHKRRREQRHGKQTAQALAPHRGVIVSVEARKLLFGKNGNGAGHVGSGLRGKRPGRWSPASSLFRLDQDAFFLRSASSNLISSMVPSQSLVVAGWKPFFWPSDRRSNAALSLVGASANALAIAAL